MERERIDEALELLWLLDEEGHSEMERFRLSSDDPSFQDLLDALIQEDLEMTDRQSSA